MTTLELTDFIGSELRGLWPDWEPSDAEVTVWSNRLKTQSYAAAKAAVQAYYTNGGSTRRRPDVTKLGKFLALPGRGDRPPGAGQPDLLCYLQGQGNAQDRRAVYMPPGHYTPEQRRAAAEQTAHDWHVLYGDTYAIFWPADEAA